MSTKLGHADSYNTCEYFLNTQRPVAQALCDPEEASVCLITVGAYFLFVDPFFNHVKS